MTGSCHGREWWGQTLNRGEPDSCPWAQGWHQALPTPHPEDAAHPLLVFADNDSSSPHPCTGLPTLSPTGNLSPLNCGFFFSSKDMNFREEGVKTSPVVSHLFVCFVLFLRTPSLYKKLYNHHQLFPEHFITNIFSTH